MARYLVLGARGQLGRDLCPRLPGEVIGVGRDRADLTEPHTVQAILKETQPQVVINCAAYNFVDRAESEPEVAFAINAFGVRALAEACAKEDATLVHFSSDYVFGLKSHRVGPWKEKDAPGPISVYGSSKLAGEYFVRALCPKHFVIRTCGLYGVWGAGGKGGNLVETMLRLQKTGKLLRVVCDQVCTPTYTADLAEAVVKLIGTDKFGLYHLTNSGSCSWHEFALRIFTLAGIPVTMEPISSTEYGAAARRPSYSVLDHRAYCKLGFPALRRWPEALAAYLQERTQRM
ncbi:MAG TPA: dTDP-4-dehydrorhamnose reductase [Gemmataceae bacterium]|nr:dTDP-4-dehydrorhamnose reductase [Gemmataceae bacterium]